MLRAIATVGYLGHLPRLGGPLAALAGLSTATLLYLLTLQAGFVLAGWVICLGLVAAALPRALASSAVRDDTILIDRFAGIWIAGAPLIPMAALIVATEEWWLLAPAMLLPVAVFHALHALLLKRLARSPRPLYRIGDDLIAGTLTMAVMFLVLLSSLYFLFGQNPY